MDQATLEEMLSFIYSNEFNEEEANISSLVTLIQNRIFTENTSVCVLKIFIWTRDNTTTYGPLYLFCEIILHFIWPEKQLSPLKSRRTDRCLSRRLLSSDYVYLEVAAFYFKSSKWMLR